MKKRLQIRNAFKLWQGDVIFFQETKIDSIQLMKVQNLWGNRFADRKFLESNGASCGFICYMGHKDGKHS